MRRRATINKIKVSDGINDTRTHHFSLRLVLPRKKVAGAARDGEDLNHGVKRQLESGVSTGIPTGECIGLAAITITVRVMTNRGAKAECRGCDGDGSGKRRKENRVCGRGGGEETSTSSSASAYRYSRTDGAEPANCTEGCTQHGFAPFPL